MKNDEINSTENDELQVKNGAILVQNVDKITKLNISKGVPHIFEIYKESNPYLSIHDGNTTTFKIGIRELKNKKGLFRIVSMKNNGNGGNPDVEMTGISMTKNSEVGIGTDNPQERLHVNGNLKVDGEIIMKSKNDSTANLTSLINTLYQEIDKLNNKVAELERKI